MELKKELKGVMMMKALITDEYGEGASIIDGPEEIITKLKEYLLNFDNYEYKKLAAIFMSKNIHI